MFPSEFEYLVPSTLEEALAVLAERGEEAKVLAGGQSLIPLMKLRFAVPTLIVDINRIPGLDTLEQGDGRLRIGALVRNRTLERSEELKAGYPTVAAAAPLISDPLIRNQGTLAGSLCHADPQGDFGSVMLALEGELVARSATGERTIAVTELFDGPFSTVLRPDELAVEARAARPAGEVFGTYLKLERKVGDFATVGVALFLATEGGTVQRAGIALTGVGPTNIKASTAEQALVGQPLTDATIDEAAHLAAEASDPRSDHRGSADYKRDVVRVYVGRGLRQSLGALVA